MTLSTQQDRAGGSLGLGTAKYLYTGYFVAGCVVAYLVTHLLDSAWEGHDNVAILAGVGAGFVVTMLAWRSLRLRTLAQETIDELAAVTWPSRDETTTATTVVLATSALASVIIFLLDRFWNWITDVIYLS